MLEFLSLCVAPINLFFTVMLIGVLFYWALFLSGLVGLDLFDTEVDLAAEPSVDMDADVDFELDGTEDLSSPAECGTSTGTLLALLRWIGVGEVPVMVLISAMVGSLWAVSILGSHFLNPEQHWLTAALWLGPNLCLSLLLTRLISWPAGYIFRRSNVGIAKPTKMLGRTCVITTSTVTDSFGQATFMGDGVPITLNVRCRVGDRPLQKGDEAVILEVMDQKGVYIVVPFMLEMS